MISPDWDPNKYGLIEVDIATLGGRYFMLIWNEALTQIRKKMSHPSFATWFENTSLHTIDEDTSTITIITPNEFSRDWLESRYAELIVETLQDITGTLFTVRFIVGALESSQPARVVTLQPSQQSNLASIVQHLQQKMEGMSAELENTRNKVNELQLEVTVLKRCIAKD